jgi:hypothetical protein
MTFSHLPTHCFLVRSGPCAATASKSTWYFLLLLALQVFFTVLVRLASSSSVHSQKRGTQVAISLFGFVSVSGSKILGETVILGSSAVAGKSPSKVVASSSLGYLRLVAASIRDLQISPVLWALGAGALGDLALHCAAHTTTVASHGLGLGWNGVFVRDPP